MSIMFRPSVRDFMVSFTAKDLFQALAVEPVLAAMLGLSHFAAWTVAGPRPENMAHY